MAANNFKGSKYDATRGMDFINEVVPMMRKEVRTLTKAFAAEHALSNVKVSVWHRWAACTHYTHGVDVKLTFSASAHAQIYHNKIWTSLYDSIVAALESYNYDKSDPQVDSYSVRFYHSMQFAVA